MLIQLFFLILQRLSMRQQTYSLPNDPQPSVRHEEAIHSETVV
jgi:hypothetical protein